MCLARIACSCVSSKSKQSVVFFPSDFLDSIPLSFFCFLEKRKKGNVIFFVLIQSTSETVQSERGHLFDLKGSLVSSSYVPAFLLFFSFARSSLVLALRFGSISSETCFYTDCLCLYGRASRNAIERPRHCQRRRVSLHVWSSLLSWASMQSARRTARYYLHV